MFIEVTGREVTRFLVWHRWFVVGIEEVMEEGDVGEHGSQREGIVSAGEAIEGWLRNNW